MKQWLMLWVSVGLAILAVAASGQTVGFDFNSGPLHAPTPLDQVSAGIRAHFSDQGYGYSIQDPAQVIGMVPEGFSGYCLCPNTIYKCDLYIKFYNAATGVPQPMKYISLLYAPQELACDSSATMRIRAYRGTTYVGTNTTTAPNPGTWPTGNLTFGNGQPFDNVQIHYDSPPPTGGDYGVIFVVDNVSVTLFGIPRPPVRPIWHSFFSWMGG